MVLCWSVCSDGHIAIFDGATGKVIEDSGFTIATSVPADAVFTDTTYDVFDDTTDGLVPAASALVMPISS